MKKPFWCTLLSVLLAAALAAAVCYLVYRYRESIRALGYLVKDKLKKLPGALWGDDGDFEEI